MPDIGQLLVLLTLGLPAAALIALPLLRPEAPAAASDGDREAFELQRRVAYEAIRDLDADLAAGGITPEQHETLRADAEGRASAALVALDAVEPASRPPVPGATVRGGRRLAAAIGLPIAGIVLVGFLLPAPVSLANPTVVDEALAVALAREEARRERIEQLTARISGDPGDSAALSQLADAYLEGASRDDLVAAAFALLALIEVEPDRQDAYTRLITAYIRAEDYPNAAAATDALEELAPDSPDVAFFRGLVALRGDGDRDAAVAAFDLFLELAPEDPRAGMVRSLRAEAAGELPPAPAASVEPETPESP